MGAAAVLILYFIYVVYCLLYCTEVKNKKNEKKKNMGMATTHPIGICNKGSSNMYPKLGMK